MKALKLEIKYEFKYGGIQVMIKIKVTLIIMNAW